MAPTHLRARWVLSQSRSALHPSRIPQSGPRLAFGPRYASTSTSSVPAARAKLVLYTTALGTTLVATYLYATDTRASLLHQYLIPPLLRLLVPDAENAHHLGTATLQTLYALGLHPRDRSPDPPALATTVFGAALANPVGISAGLDKDAAVPDALFALGAAVVEVGGCTPRPQAGNPQPRVWRVPAIDGLVNRYGLNSAGADKVAARLRARLAAFARAAGLSEADVLDGRAGVPPGALVPGRLLAVQVAKGKDTDERDAAAVARDYVYCVRRLGRYADVLVVNVSSPNTPGLRDLQAAEPLAKLLAAVVDEAGRTGRRTPPRVLVKVSPDEDSDSQVEGICRAVWESGVDGVVVGNTTKRRTGLVPPGVELRPREQRALLEAGGFSGPALFQHTLQLVGRYRKILDQQSLSVAPGGAPAVAVPALPSMDGIVPEGTGSVRTSSDRKVIFASGGITNGEQALQVLNAGASVAMVYTGLVYGGAGTITRMKGELRDGAQPGGYAS